MEELRCPKCGSTDIIPPGEEYPCLTCDFCAFDFPAPEFKGQHLGDPCIFCGMPRNKVSPGPCSGPPKWLKH